MDTMVITFGEDGTIQHTLKDKFFNPLSKHKKRKVTRMSEIIFDEVSQSFYIRMETPDFMTKTWSFDFPSALTHTALEKTFGPGYRAINELKKALLGSKRHPAEADVITFPTYEDAVDAEIAIINLIRLAGFTFVK